MTPAQSIAESAAQITCTHGHASAADVLELVMQGTEGTHLDFTDPAVPNGSHAWPTTPFGQLIATVFDSGMQASDWNLLNRPERAVVECLSGIWQTEVLPKFAAHFRLGSVKG